MKKYFIFLSIISLLLTACGSNKETSKQSSVTFVDDTKHTIKLDKKPKKVVSLMHIGIPDALLAAGVQPVGAASASTVLNKWPAYDIANKKAVDIGSAQEPDLEKIIDLNPDVIIGAKGVHDQYRESLEKIAPVILLDINDNKKNGIPMVKRMAKLFGTKDKAEQTIKQYKKSITDYKKKIQSLLPKGSTVLFTDYYQKEFLLFPKDISATNNEGLAMKLPSNYPKNTDLPIDTEGLQSMNPDYIFFISPSKKDYESALQYLKNDAAWKQINAVKKNHIYYQDISSYTYNGVLTNLYGMEQTIKSLKGSSK